MVHAPLSKISGSAPERERGRERECERETHLMLMQDRSPSYIILTIDGAHNDKISEYFTISKTVFKEKNERMCGVNITKYMWLHTSTNTYIFVKPLCLRYIYLMVLNLFATSIALLAPGSKHIDVMFYEIIVKCTA